MAVKVAHAQPDAGEVPVKPVLGVLLLYEDLGTALRARQSLDLLARQLGADMSFNNWLWRLDLLGEPLLVEQAAVEAAAADVIFLSLHGRKELRAEVCNWLSRWLDHKEDRPYALAALLDPDLSPPGGGNRVLAYLQEVAATAGADLFYGACPVPIPR